MNWLKTFSNKLKNAVFSEERRIKWFLATPNRLRVSRERLCVVVVAFNNVFIIKKQYEFLKTYLEDDFSYLIIDNSNDSRVSRSIGKMSNSVDVHYVKMRKNPAPIRGASFSHGLALEWARINVLADTKAFLILDHDIFPYKPVSIMKMIEGLSFYGVRHERGTVFYLWPGLMAGNTAEINVNRLNFLPQDGLDTGGGSAGYLQSLSSTQFRFTSQWYFDIRHIAASGEGLLQEFLEGRNVINDEMKRELVESDHLVEVLDGWIHFFNISNWKGTKDKMEIVERVLDLLALRT